MPKTKLFAVPVLLALLVVPACDTNVYVGGPSQINQQGGSGGPLPSPSPGAGLVASVSIAEFGERCPGGGAPAESVPRQVRVGCTADVTCNPRDASGKVIFDVKVTGVLPDSFSQVAGSGAAKFAQDDDNGFNGTVSGLATGSAALVCVVKGVSSPPWEIEVVP